MDAYPQVNGNIQARLKHIKTKEIDGNCDMDMV